MIKNKMILTLICLPLFAGCEFGGNGDTPATNPADDIEGETSGDTGWVDDHQGDNNSDFSIVSESEYTVEGNCYKITSAGTYTLSGTLNGYIHVEAGEADVVELELNGVTIQNSDTYSPIFCLEADTLKVKSIDGTFNYIKDNRTPVSTTSDDDEEVETGGGAIYSKCDTNLVGKGSLSVEGKFNNGVHCTKDLKIKNTVLSVKSLNHAFKGNDSVTVESGTLTLVSETGDGIKTRDSDISDKQKQRGNIDIQSGTINIYSAADGIDAAYNATIGTDKNSPKINIFTNKFSGYTGESSEAETSNETLYLKTSYSSYKFSAKIYTSESDYKWVNFSKTSERDQGRYYIHKGSLPKNAKYITLYVYTSDQTQGSDTAYKAVTEKQSINTYYNCVSVSINGTTASIKWTNYSTGGQGGPGGGGFGPGEQTNTDKADYSAKGIKADNILTINNCELSIKAYDDGLHANSGETLENGENGVGDIIINNGQMNIYSTDDGIHADHYLTINNGNITIEYAYEGVEGNNITINDGTVKVVLGKDDGINSSTKKFSNASITINGGLVDVTVATGDVDGIDSNGTYTQTGGVVITRGPQSGANQNATGLDTDGTASISGGTLVCFNKPQTTPRCSNGVSAITTYQNKSQSAGTYTLAIESDSFTYSFNLPATYSQGAYIYSNKTVTITKQ